MIYRIGLIERKVQQVINLNVNNNYGVSNISINSTSKTTLKKWELTDELKQQITEYALEDAKNGYPIYCHSCYLKNKTGGRVRRECGHIKELEGKLDSYREYVNISVH